MREVVLTTGDSAVLCATSGPYTDPEGQTGARRGLSGLRAAWIAERGDTEVYEDRPGRPEDDGRPGTSATSTPCSRPATGDRRPLRASDGGAVTQLAYARRGVVTAEMEFIAGAGGIVASRSARRSPAAGR